MSNKQKIARSALLITVLGLISKPLGFIREMLMAARFGGTVQMDAYLLSITAIGLFTTLLNNAIRTTLIPILAEVESKEGKEGKLSHTNNILNIIIVGSVLLSLVALIFSKYIMKMMALGFTGKDFNLALLLMRIGIPAIIFNSIQGVFTGYLQSEERFLETAAVGLPMNAVFITFLLFLSNKFGIVGLSVTSVLASLTQLIFIYRGANKTNYKYQLHIDLHDEYLKKMLVLIPPILISVGIGDLNAIIDKSIGSTLVKGSISALNFAEKLAGLVQGIFITAINTVMYPIFSREALKEDHTGLKKTMIQTTNLILLITVPATVAMMVLATPIVKAAFQRGEFDSTATLMTSSALIFTAVRMISGSINMSLNNIYYSLKDTKTPLILSLVSVAVNITLNFVFIGPLKHNGLALATTISSIFAMVVSIYFLRKKIGSFGFMDSVIVFIKTVTASLVMGAAVYFLHSYLIQKYMLGKIVELGILILVSLVGVTIYAILILILDVEEVNFFIGTLKKRLKG